MPETGAGLTAPDTVRQLQMALNAKAKLGTSAGAGGKFRLSEGMISNENSVRESCTPGSKSGKRKRDPSGD